MTNISINLNNAACETIKLWSGKWHIKCGHSLYVCTELNNELRWGADKSLPRYTYLCRRTEPIVSQDWGICSCAELQAFLVSESERNHVRWRARFQQHQNSIFHPFFFCKAMRLRKLTPETLGEHALSYATVKKWVAHFKRGDFSTCDAPRPGRPKTVTTPVIID